MKTIGDENAGPITATDALIDFDEAKPGPHDLLVSVRGVSVNPVDVKVREFAQPEGSARILVFDAAGVVQSVGGFSYTVQSG